MRMILAAIITICALSTLPIKGEEAVKFYLTVNSPIEGCKVMIDGVEQGITPLITELQLRSFQVEIQSPSGELSLKEQVSDISEDRIILLADFEHRTIKIYRTSQDIIEYVSMESRLKLFRTHYSRALAHYAKKEMLCALVEIDKALAAVSEPYARRLLLTLRKDMLPANFAYIDGGQFNMGQNELEFPSDAASMPNHPVLVSDFAIGKYEVTNAEFDAFVKDAKYMTTAERKGSIPVFDKEKGQWKLIANGSWRNPFGPESSYKYKPELPVCLISYRDAVAYTQWANAKFNSPVFRFRLPTEAEWEYIARNGGTSRFPWGDEADTQGNKYAVVSTSWFLKGGSRPEGANKSGVHDLIGNLWEWTLNYADTEYYKSCLDFGIVVDPMGPQSGTHRVARGGAFDSSPEFARSTKRLFLREDEILYNVGFRVALEYTLKVTSCE